MTLVTFVSLFLTWCGIGLVDFSAEYLWVETKRGLDNGYWYCEVVDEKCDWGPIVRRSLRLTEIGESGAVVGPYCCSTWIGIVLDGDVLIFMTFAYYFGLGQ